MPAGVDVSQVRYRTDPAATPVASGVDVSHVVYRTPTSTGGVDVAQVVLRAPGTTAGVDVAQVVLRAPQSDTSNAPLEEFVGGVWVTVDLEAFDGATWQLVVTPKGVPPVQPTPDTTAPSVPVPQVTGVTTASVALAWTASTDDRGGLVVYDVLRDGVKVNPTLLTGTSYTVGGLPASTTSSFTVEAVDEAGNRARSAVVTGTTATPAPTPPPADTQPPTAPTNLVASQVTQTGVRLAWTASTDNVGVTKYRVLSGSSVLAEPTGTSVTLTGLAPGTTYTLAVVALDAAGNQSVAAQVQVRTLDPADTTAPTVALSAPAAGASLTGTVAVTGTASDNVGVQSVTVYAGSTALGAATLSGSNWTYQWATTGTANGQVTLTARARDAAGNETTSAGRVVTVQNAVSPPVPAPTGKARWWLGVGVAPHTRVTYETQVVESGPQAGRVRVAWVSSMPDARPGTSLLEVDVPTLAQDAWEAYVADVANPTVRLAESGIVTGDAESWIPATFTPVGGTRYLGFARTRSSDGKWSAWESTRFVAPTGRVLYFEDFGAVGDGVNLDGTDYPAQIYNGPIRQALSAAKPGDVVRSKQPGIVLEGVRSAQAQLTSPAAVFTQSMVGKKIMVYGGGSVGAETDKTITLVHRTTVQSVAADGKSALLAASVRRDQASCRVVIGYPTYRTNHIDMDANTGGGVGGFTVDGYGCLFFANREKSAGFCSNNIPDVTMRDIHYWSPAAGQRGNDDGSGDGKNADSGPFFYQGAKTIGGRTIRCWAELANDAGFLWFSGPADHHVVDCVADHTNADPFHITSTAHHIYFIRPLSVYCGDDLGNIGYRSEGDAKRPYEVYWESPTTLGQDWGRSLAYGGTYRALATDVYIDGGAMANFLIGSDGDQANTNDVQIRRFRIVNSRIRTGQRASYSQRGQGGLIQDGMWLKMLVNRGTESVPQARILLEKGRVTDGGYMQIVTYGGGEFDDASTILRDITMDGVVNQGWVDQATYNNRIDLRGINPVGRTPITIAPTAAKGVPPGANMTGAW